MRVWSLHPNHLDRMGLLACWRETLLAQATRRGYRVDASRIIQAPIARVKPTIPVNRGQLEYEWQHLGKKLSERSPEGAEHWLKAVPNPAPALLCYFRRHRGVGADRVGSPTAVRST